MNENQYNVPVMTNPNKPLILDCPAERILENNPFKVNTWLNKIPTTIKIAEIPINGMKSKRIAIGISKMFKNPNGLVI